MTATHFIVTKQLVRRNETEAVIQIRFYISVVLLECSFEVQQTKRKRK